MKNFGSALLLLAASASMVASLPAVERPGDVMVARAPIEQAMHVRSPELASRKKENDAADAAAAEGVSTICIMYTPIDQYTNIVSFLGRCQQRNSPCCRQG